METKAILEYAMADYSLGRKAALRCLIWFGFGYHKAALEGDKAARDYLTDVRALLKNEGAVKSEQSTKAKVTKAVGEAFGQMFGPELASAWESDAHMVQACFIAAQASGATTVQRLEDWARHGDANHTDAAKERAAKEKADKLEADAAARRDVDPMNAAPLGFDVVPEQVQNLNPAAEPAEIPAETVDDAVAALVERFGFEAVYTALEAAANADAVAVAG